MILCWLKAIGATIGVIIGGFGFAFLLCWILDKWKWTIYVLFGLVVVGLVTMFYSSLCG